MGVGARRQHPPGLLQGDLPPPQKSPPPPRSPFLFGQEPPGRPGRPAGPPLPAALRVAVEGGGGGGGRWEEGGVPSSGMRPG